MATESLATSVSEEVIKSGLGTPSTVPAPAAPAAPATTEAAPATPAPATPAPAAPAAPAAPVTPAPAAPTKLGITDIPATLLGETPAAPAAPAAPADDKGANFAAMRLRNDEQQRLIDTLRAEKQKYLGDDGSFKLPEDVQKQITDKDAELQRLSDQLSQVDFARSPQFEKEYQAPLNRTYEKVVAAVKEFGGADPLAGQLANLGLKDRFQLLQQQLPEAAAVLMPLFNQLDDSVYKRNQALTDHKQLSTQLAERATVEQQTQIHQVRNAVRDKVLSSLEAEGNFVFSEVPGNEEWNGKVAIFKGAVDTLINSDNIELQTEALALSVAAPVYRGLYEQERTRSAELEKQLQRFQKATPGVAVGGGTGTPSTIDGKAFSADAAVAAVTQSLMR